MQSMSPEYVCEAQTSDGRDAEAIARRACGPRRDVPAASRPAHEPRPIGAAIVRSMRHQDRQGRIGKDVAGGSAENHLPQSALGIGALDQQVAL